MATITAIETTIKQITGMTMKELDAFAATSDLAACAENEVTEAVRLIARHKDELRQAIRTAQRDLERTIDTLDTGYGLNSCGILQGTGLRIDQLAALREEAYSRLKSACRTVAAITDVVGSYLDLDLA